MSLDIEACIPEPLNMTKNLDDISKLQQIVLSYFEFETNINSKKSFEKFIFDMKRKHHLSFGIAELRYVYKMMLSENKIKLSKKFEQFAKVKTVRENSGVMVFTLLTSPYPETGEFDPDFKNKSDINYKLLNPETGEKRQNFSCPFDCFYCPNEPGQPRSYLKEEPAVARANRNNFDAVLQIRDRAKTYIVNGLDVDKGEFIIEGGTYTSYPKTYRIRFIRDIFYAANTIYDKDFIENPRKRLSLEEEIKINESAKFRIIGITIETRPDSLENEHLIEFRECGITRVQLGLQHTDDFILKKINRKCTTLDAIKTIQKLKDCGFKVDVHMMPDLPFSDPELDEIMLLDIINNTDLRPDQVKVYPTAVTPFTVIKRWYEQGKYKPYAETLVDKVITISTDGKEENKIIKINPLVEVIIKYKENVPIWMRNNRIVRDIPNKYIEGGNGITNLRQIVQDEMKKRGKKCKCIRCREVKNQEVDLKNAKLFVTKYEASEGIEYFISFENHEQTILYGFLRLRITKDAGYGVFDELKGSALIRELHVYGKMQPVNIGDSKENSSQHAGFGTKLLIEAEKIVKEYNISKLAVISGVGVREYYRKRGYMDYKYYLIKNI